MTLDGIVWFRNLDVIRLKEDVTRNHLDSNSVSMHSLKTILVNCSGSYFEDSK